MFDYLDERCNDNYCYSLIYVNEEEVITKDIQEIATILNMEVENLKDTMDKFNLKPMNVDFEVEFIAFDKEIAAFKATEYLNTLIKRVA